MVNITEYLKSKNIFIGTYVADQAENPNYYKLVDLFEEYDKLNLYYGKHNLVPFYQKKYDMVLSFYTVYRNYDYKVRETELRLELILLKNSLTIWLADEYTLDNAVDSIENANISIEEDNIVRITYRNKQYDVVEVDKYYNVINHLV